MPANEIVSKAEVDGAKDYFRLTPSSFHIRMINTLQQAMSLLEELRETGIGGDIDYEPWDSACLKADALLAKYNGGE